MYPVSLLVGQNYLLCLIGYHFFYLNGSVLSTPGFIYLTSKKMFLHML